MKNNINQITSIHYITGSILLAFYGARVCPFLETLTILQLSAPIIIGFLLALLFRINIQKTISKLPLQKQIKSQFITEISIFIFVGSALAVFNTLYYKFPIESGMKVLFGTLLLGVFIGIDQVLMRERIIMNELIKKGKNIHVENNYLSIPSKFIFMSVLMIGSIATVLIMVISKDLDWYHEHGMQLEFMQAKLSILGEITFIILIINF